MTRTTLFGRTCLRMLLAVLVLWLIVAPRPAQAACSLSDLYTSITNGATNGVAFLKEHPECASYMDNPVYWIAVGAVSVSMLHAKDQIVSACAEVQAANDKLAKKVKDASDDAVKIDGWMKTFGFSDEARAKVQEVFGDVTSAGGDIGGFTGFLACACATVQTAGIGEIVKFGNDCVVDGICAAQEWVDDALDQGGGSCKPQERPLEMIDCADPQHPLIYESLSLKTDDKGFYSFVDLAPGQDYVVVFTKPDGTTFTTPLAGDVAKDSNPNASGVAPVHTPKSGQNSATTPDDPTKQ